MAKRDVNSKGKFIPRIECKYISTRQLDAIDAEIFRQNNIKQKPQLGPRAVAWKAFKQHGKVDDACSAVEKIFGKSFKKETICQWLKEEMNKAQDKGELEIE